MKSKTIILAAAALMTCAAAEAGTWTRVVTGPRGNTASRTVQSNCIPVHQTSRTVVRTGSNGKTAVTTRTVTCAPQARVIVAVPRYRRTVVVVRTR